jgi:hypothetical protein
VSVLSTDEEARRLVDDQPVSGEPAPGRDVVARTWIGGGEVEEPPGAQRPQPQEQVDDQLPAAEVAGVPAVVRGEIRLQGLAPPGAPGATA